MSVSEEGAVFSNGTSSETVTCFLLIHLNIPGRIELVSSKYEGKFLGIEEDGSVKAATKGELYAVTFWFASYSRTPLRLADTDVDCALHFSDDAIAQNACYLDIGSGSGSSMEPTTSTIEPDLFTFFVDLACLP